MTQLMEPIVLSCGAAKLDLKEGEYVQAWKLYQGGYFKIMLDTATKLSNNIWILSAGYGLIPANAMITKYDIKMNKQIASFMLANKHAVFSGKSLLGDVYSSAVEGNLENLIPKMGMGKKQQYAKNLVEGLEPLIDLNTLPDGEYFQLVTPPNLYEKTSKISGASGIPKVSENLLINALRFVKGAIAKKEIIDGLTHVIIENGQVRSSNGVMALCSPIPLDIDCKPKAAPFIKAIEHCDETVHLSMTPAGKLRVKSGKFRVLIECIDESDAHVLPEGDVFEVQGEALYNALKLLEPFVSDDASKPWSNGIKLEGEIASATNNVIAIEHWTKSHFPYVVNLHRSMIKEMIRIRQHPIKAQTDGRSITFHYENGEWIRSNLLTCDWPNFGQILDIKCNPKPLPDNLFEGLSVVKPFLAKDNRVFFEDGMLKTHLHDDDEGATFEVQGLDDDKAFNLPMLEKLEGIAKTIDFDATARTALFYGENLRGAITRMIK